MPGAHLVQLPRDGPARETPAVQLGHQVAAHQKTSHHLQIVLAFRVQSICVFSFTSLMVAEAEAEIEVKEQPRCPEFRV